MTKRIMSFSLAIALLGACIAQAANIEVTPVKSDSSVAGHVTNDIMLNFDDILRGQQMILELTSGAVFQHAAPASNSAPSGALFNVPGFENIKYDTFFTIGGLSAEESGAFIEVGGAVNIAPGAAKKFDTEGLNIAWAPGTGVDVPNGSDYVTARITLTEDAAGTLKYFASTADGTETTFDFDIAGGVIGGGGGDNTPPTGTDALIDNVLAGAQISHTFAATDAETPSGPFTWSNLQFVGGPGFGGTGDPGPNAPTLTPEGVLAWNTAGAARGIYTATATVADPEGATGDATLTVNVTGVPEPSTIALLGLTVVGVAGLVRRRG